MIVADAVFFRSDEAIPIALERLSLEDGHSDQLVRLDVIQDTEVIRAQRWQVSMGGRELAAYAYTPRGAPPAHGWPCIVWLHGAASSFSPRWHTYAQYFAHSGFVFVALNFSGSPGLPWYESDPAALHARQVEEAQQLRQLLATRSDIDSHRVFLVGVSLGTRILQDVLRSDPHAYAGAVEYSPITTGAWQTPRSNLPPLLVYLADNDPYLNLSERLTEIDRQRAMGSRVEVIRFHDEGHDIRGLSAVAGQLADTVRFLRSIDSH